MEEKINTIIKTIHENEKKQIEVNVSLSNLISEIKKMNKNIEKIIDIEKDVIKIKEVGNNRDEKIKNIESKMGYITKIFITTLLVAILNFFFDFGSVQNLRNEQKIEKSK